MTAQKQIHAWRSATVTAQTWTNENAIPSVRRTYSADGKKWKAALLIGREDSADRKRIFQWLMVDPWPFKEHILSKMSRIWRNINHFNIQAVLSLRSSIEDLRLKWSSFCPHFTQNAFLSPFSPYVTYLRNWKCVPLPSNRCRKFHQHGTHLDLDLM